MEGGDDLLLGDAALPTPLNILYDAYTGGNNSGGTRHDIPICRRPAVPVANTRGSMLKIVAQVVIRRRRCGQMWMHAWENRKSTCWSIY